MGPEPGAVPLGYNPYEVGGAPSYAWYYSSGGRTVWGGSGPAVEAAPVVPALTEGGAGLMSGVSTTPIPVSWGQRRIIGVVIDKIVKAIGADGIGSEILDVSAGTPLFRDVANDLSKIVANGTTIYDVELGGIIHPALTSVVWYDGTDDAQIQDPTFVAAKGADVTSGYVRIMHAILDFNSYAPWGGARPGITLFITDAGHGTLFTPWGGTLDPGAKDADIVLSGGDLHAKNLGTGFGSQGNVLGTIGRSSGRRVFEFQQTTAGARVGLAQADVNLGWFLGSQDGHSFGWAAADGTIYINTIFAGTWAPYTTTDRVQILVDLTTKRMWGTLDGVNYYGTGGGPYTVANVIAGTGGLDISGLVSPLYPALGLENNSGLGGVEDEAEGYFEASAFLYTPPGAIGSVNWGDVFVELAPLCNIPAEKVNAITITEEAEGGAIYGGLSWSQAIKNSGKLANIDFWEDFDEINIKQTAFDPAADLSAIPSKHRYITSEEKGSIEASRGGEPRKPTVVELSYYDTSRQFQLSMVPARSEVHDSVTVDKITTFWVMTAAAAADRSAIALGKTEMEFQEFNHELPPIVPYVRLRPADIVYFDEEGIDTQTMLTSWGIETDWTVKTEYKYLYRSTQPEIPLTLEAVDPSLPLHIPWRLDFRDNGNSGYVAAISGQ